jgi:hypothetical protein
VAQKKVRKTRHDQPKPAIYHFIVISDASVIKTACAIAKESQIFHIIAI